MHTLSSLPNFSALASRRSANLSINFARCASGVDDQLGKAAFAAATARSTSASEATWTLSVTTVSSLGLLIVRASPDDDGIY